MTTSNDNKDPSLSEQDLILLERLRNLTDKVSSDMRSTLNDVRSASSVKLAAIVTQVELLESRLNRLTDIIEHDDPQAEHPTSLTGKVRVMWNQYTGRFKWGSTQWVNVIQAILTWAAITYLAGLWGSST